MRGRRQFRRSGGCGRQHRDVPRVHPASAAPVGPTAAPASDRCADWRRATGPPSSSSRGLLKVRVSVSTSMTGVAKPLATSMSPKSCMSTKGIGRECGSSIGSGRPQFPQRVRAKAAEHQQPVDPQHALPLREDQMRCRMPMQHEVRKQQVRGARPRTAGALRRPRPSEASLRHQRDMPSARCCSARPARAIAADSSTPVHVACGYSASSPARERPSPQPTSSIWRGSSRMYSSRLSSRCSTSRSSTVARRNPCHALIELPRHRFDACRHAWRRHDRGREFGRSRAERHDAGQYRSTLQGFTLQATAFESHGLASGCGRSGDRDR